MNCAKYDVKRFILFSIIYFVWIAIIGSRSIHLFLYVILSFLYFKNIKTQIFVVSFLPFIFILLLYDTLKIYPNYLVNDVIIEELYLAELNLFGFSYNGVTMTLNEILFYYQNSIFDFVTGICYLLWFPLPMVLALYLYFFSKRSIYFYFVNIFLLSNIIGFIFYYICPAAPPWYVDVHGFDFVSGTLAEASRLKNFDLIIGFPLYEKLYSLNENVFAALPSLHAAIPLACFLTSLKLKSFLIKIALFTICVFTWFGAIYSNQHYLIDVLLGIFIVGIVYFILETSRYYAYFKGGSFSNIETLVKKI